MSQHNIIILETNTSEQVDVFKSLAKALKVKFEVKENPYNPEFVTKIEISRKQIANGNYTEVKPENLKSFLESL